jgi:hypothetical protein
MPITDIQKVSPRLSRLGIVRLGIKKQSNGKEYPADVAHFVLTDAPDLAAAYGPNPDALQIYLPFATLDENLIAYHELWKASGCVCRGDGQRIIDLMGPDGKKLIRDGQVLRDYAERDSGAHLENGDSYQAGDVVPCPGLEHSLYPRCADCKPSAVLIAMVRDPRRPVQLVGDRLGYYQIRTHSFYNIQNLTGQLAYAAQVAERMGRDLRGIPMILRRVARELAYTDKDGQRKTSTKHLLDLEFDPQWVQWANAGMRALATGELPALPDYIDVDPDTGEIVDAESGNGDAAPAMILPEFDEVTGQGEPFPAQTIQPGKTPARPWGPETLARKLLESVEKHIEARPGDVALIGEDAARKIATVTGNILNGIASNEVKRHALLNFVFGVETSFYLSIAQRDVWEGWLKRNPPLAREEAALAMDWLTSRPQAEAAQAEPEAEVA